MKDSQTLENDSGLITQETLFDEQLDKGNFILEIGNYEEAEGNYSEAFFIALKLGDLEKQANALVKLGDAYRVKAQQDKIKQNFYSVNFNKAIALYNAALVKTENEDCKNNIIEQIKETEYFFLENIGINDRSKISTHDSDKSHQAKLIEIRTEINEIIKLQNSKSDNGNNKIVFKIENIQYLYLDITNKIKAFILELINECKIILGVPTPCNYAIIALGSLAREEMTPYSDFEWAILIENRGEKRNKRSEKYFRDLTNLLHIRVINLGETILPSIMEIKFLEDKNYYDDISTRGFCFDGLMSHACKWPLGNMYLDIGKNEKFKLIGTPNEIVSRYINKESFDKNRGLFSVLSNTKLIEGDNQLYQNFIERRQIALEQNIFINKIEKTYKLREYAALAFLRANVISYLPRIGKLIDNKQKGIKRVYPVKNDLYRLPHLILDSLALYYSLNSASSWDIINGELSVLQSNDGVALFNEVTINYFKDSFDQVASLRLNHYLKANSQRDEIELESDDENEKLLKLYEFHIYLNDAAYDFAFNDNVDHFNTLPNEHHLARIRVLEKLSRYEEVEIECKANKNREDLGLGFKLNILNRLGLAQFHMGKEQEAYNTLDEYRQIEGLNENNPFNCIILYNQALALSNMGKYADALKSINTAIGIIEDKYKLEKIKSLYKIKVFDSYQFYQEKASILLRLGNLKEARENFEKADKEVEEYYKHGKNGEYWNFKADLAQVYAEFGNIELINSEQAKKLYDEAIKGLSDCLGAMHSNVASAVSRKAQLLMYKTKHQEALEHYEQALFIYRQNGKEHHSIEIAKCLSDKSICYVWRGEYELAIKYINEAIKLYEEKEIKLGLNPRLKASALTNLAKTSQEMFLKKVREERISASEEVEDEINLVFKQYKDVFETLAQANCGVESVDLTFIFTNLANFLLEIENIYYLKYSKKKERLKFHKIKEKLKLSKSEIRALCIECADIGMQFISNHIKENGQSVRAIDVYGGILNAKASILLKIYNPKEPVVNLFLKAKQKLQEFFPDNKNMNLIISNTNIGRIYYKDAKYFKYEQPSKSEEYKVLAAKYFLLSLQWSSNSEAFIKQKPIMYFELAKLLRDFDLKDEAKYYATLALENETYLSLSLTESDRRQLSEIKRYKNKSKLQLKNWFKPIEEELSREGSFQDLNIQEANLNKLPEELERQWNKLVNDLASKQKVTHPIILEIHNNIQHILEKKKSSKYTTFNPNENKLEGSIAERSQQIDKEIHLLDKQENKHDEAIAINIGTIEKQLVSKANELSLDHSELEQAGAMMTGDQLATLLQAIKEGSAVGDRIEFTSTITIDTLEDFIKRVLLPESLKKVQFGVINVVSESNSQQTSNLSKQDQIPGEHWVSYIQVPNLFDEEGNVISVRSTILNSAGESYTSSLNKIKSGIEEIFTQHKIQITLPIKHLDYQKQDLEQYHDWNTCGIWTCYFFEQTIEKIVKAGNPSEVKFEEITGYTDTAQKRQEYAELLKALDVSTNLITENDINLNIDKILGIESTEADSILEEIDKELLDKLGINAEELDLDELLETKNLKESISADNILSLVLNSLEAKELIKIIKDKANPPILDEETDLAKDQRLATLTKAFIGLSKLYIDKADAYDGEEIKQTKIQYYTEATKLLNYAISIRQDIVDKTVITNLEENRYIYYTPESTLEEINKKLVNIVEGDFNRAKIASAIENAKSDQAYLINLRRSAKAALDLIDNYSDEPEIIKTQELFEHITYQIKSYLAKVYKESEIILGIKPCDYTVIGLGSMALNQMTPYSDLEFAILTAHDEYKNDLRTKDYFNDLTHLVNFRVINLGETVMHEKDIGGALIYDLIHRGVNLDLGGKTPVLIPGKPELIQTVDKMLVLLKNQDNNPKWFDTSSILESACLVYGNTDLYNDYQKNKNKFLFNEVNKGGELNCQVRALQRLQKGVIEKKLNDGSQGLEGNIKEFTPKLVGQEYEGKVLNAKQEIYRLPDRLLYNLAIYFRIEPESAWDAVRQLYMKKIINTEAANNLYYAVTFATNLRCRVYLQNCGQQDTVRIYDSHRLIDKALDQKIETTKYLNDMFSSFKTKLFKEDELFNYYYIAMAFHQTLEDFCNKYNSFNENEKVNFFQLKQLFDGDDASKGLIYCRLTQYKEAIFYLEKALRSPFTQNKLQILNILGNIYYMFGESNKAIDYYTQFLERQKLLYKNKLISPDTSITLNNLGEAYRIGKNFYRSINYHTKNLKINKIIYNSYMHPEIATSLHNLGITYIDKGEYDKAIICDKTSLIINKFIYGVDANLKVATYLHSLGISYGKKGDIDQELKCYILSLRIKKLIYGNSIHTDIAQTLNCIGSLYHEKGMSDKSIEYHTLSLEMNKIIYKNIIHPDIASSYNNLGIVYAAKEEYDKAIRSYIKSLNIKNILYKTQQQLSIAYTLQNLGEAYRNIRDFDKAIECHTQNIAIQKKIYENSIHPDIANSLNDLAIAYYSQNDYDKAIEYIFRSLEIKEICYKSLAHPGVVKSFNNLGEAYRAKGEFDKAIEYCILSLEISKIVYKNSLNPVIVATLYNLGNIYEQKNELNNAINYYTKALQGVTDFSTHPYKRKIVDSLINTHYSMAWDYYEKNQLELLLNEYESVLSLLENEQKEIKISILNNLGCMYHVSAVRAKKASNIELSNEFIQKTEESFKQALKLNEGSINAELYIEYANFLILINHYQEAIVYLKQVVTDSTSTEGLTYGQIEKLTVNENIQNEIDFFGEINITDSVVFAYYLLINMQIKLGDTEQAGELVEQLKVYITSNTDALSYSILGYSYKSLGILIEAAAAFEQAANLYQATEDSPEYTLALENQALCLSMLVPPTAVEITAQEENKDINNAGSDESETKTKDSTEIWRVSPVYQNSLLNDQNIQAIMQTAHQYDGIDAVNQIIDLGNNQRSYIRFTESIRSENIATAIAKALSLNDKFHIASGLKDNAIPLLINNIKNPFTEQAGFSSDESFIIKNIEDTREYKTDVPKNDQFNLRSLTITSFAIKEMIEATPTLRYFAYKILGVQYVIPQVLQEIELPEFTKQNYFWVSMHYIAGTTGALTISAANIDMTTKLIAPLASSFIYGIKLKFYDYLTQQKQSALQNQNATNYTINHPIEFVEQCGLDMFAYGALSIVSNSMSMFLFGMPLSNIGYDIAISSVMGGVQCYSTYQQQLAVNTDESKTTTELVLPYIADSLVLYMATQNIHFDNGNLASSMFGIKQGLAAISTLVVTDQLTKLFLQNSHETIIEIETLCINPLLDYLNENVMSIFGETDSYFIGDKEF